MSLCSICLFLFLFLYFCPVLLTLIASDKWKQQSVGGGWLFRETHTRMLSAAPAPGLDNVCHYLLLCPEKKGEEQKFKQNHDHCIIIFFPFHIYSKTFPIIYHVIQFKSFLECRAFCYLFDVKAGRCVTEQNKSRKCI